MPVEVVKDEDLSKNALLVYIAIRSFMDSTGVKPVYPSIRSIAKRARLTRNPTKEAIKELVSSGGYAKLAERICADGRRTSNLYYLSPKRIRGGEGLTPLPPESDPSPTQNLTGTPPESDPELYPMNYNNELHNTLPAKRRVDPLHNRFLKTFSDAAPLANYGKEAKAVTRLLAYARRVDSAMPEFFLQGMIATFCNLRAGREKFWAGQPLTPSALLALAERVTEVMRRGVGREPETVQEVFK